MWEVGTHEKPNVKIRFLWFSTSTQCGKLLVFKTLLFSDTCGPKWTLVELSEYFWTFCEHL